MINLKNLGKPELADWIRSFGEKPYRARQLWSWIYLRGADSFGSMTDLSMDFRKRLESSAFVGSLKSIGKSASASTGTQKFLWECPDGSKIESVYIPEGGRRTVCVSSQVGCALACAFCATGRMGFVRNLEAWEITDQVIGVRREIGNQPTNVVVMGMGEPLLNYDNVMKAMAAINDPEGIAISHRKITVSTAGILPGIERYAAEKRPYKLAVSLNATTDAVRSRVMPVNRQYPLAALLKATREYYRKTRKRITFEYVLIDGVNDTPEDAGRLLKLLKDIPCKLNLIPLNPAGGTFGRPDDKRVAAFLDAVKPLASPVMVRMSRGVDITAACGQLATANPKTQKSMAKT
jgi:23S rRNA (adenine2503-C2)-methyltransferase